MDEGGGGQDGAEDRMGRMDRMDSSCRERMGGVGSEPQTGRAKVARGTVPGTPIQSGKES
jgi:hypothetical protein